MKEIIYSWVCCGLHSGSEVAEPVSEPDPA